MGPDSGHGGHVAIGQKHLDRQRWTLFTYSILLTVIVSRLQSCYCIDSGAAGKSLISAGLSQHVPARQSKRSSGLEGEDAQRAPQAAAGFFLAEWTDSRLNMSDPVDKKLSAILDRNGPDMRPSRDFKDFKDISVDISRRALHLLHKHFEVAIGQQIDAAWPTIERMLNESRASERCVRAMNIWASAAKRMDGWAIKMFNSWGHFPVSGLFEGTYSDVGAFDTCVGVKENKLIGHAHYCSVAFRPVLPSRKDYELIVRKEPKEVRDMFEKRRGEGEGNSQIDRSNLTNLLSTFSEPPTAAGSSAGADSVPDAFTLMLEHAQYHHFIYYKLGTCWPIDCSPFDVRRLAKLAGRKSILLNGPVKCYSMHENDYEQPDESAETQKRPGEFRANGNVTRVPDGEAGKLVISVWDKNDGIYIWKPHFFTAHKVALSGILAVSAFILFMTAIDLCANRIPRLISRLSLCLKGLPLDYHKRAHGRTHGPKMGYCTAAATISPPATTTATSATIATRQHPTKAGFLMVPTEPDADQEDAVASATAAAVANLEDPPTPPSLFMSLVDDFSALTNVPQFFRVSEGQLKNDILCLNGIRCITMVWIIIAHTMLYNDWSAFARTRAIEVALNSLITQPIFNASYLVDSFFLMSGLLSAFTAFRHSDGLASKFSSFAFIFGRWLRLTPQILFVSMLFIVFPALSSGPHWFPIVGEYSENCVKNWWINVLHLQAFYKKDEMCNFVTWWISIDFFYHFLALAIIWVIILAGHRYGFLTIAGTIGMATAYQSWRHYQLAMPPNIFSTIPQTGTMWVTMTLDFYWTPYAHSVPFFFGFYIGYLMALKKKLVLRWLNTRRALVGWLLAVNLLIAQSYSTHWWVTGKAEYARLTSTLFFDVCSFIWSGSICWIIIACQHGYGGFVNRMLSWKVFIVLGKASYLVYLSHFQVLFVFFGTQNTLLEPSTINMVYIVIGNILLSTLLGILLCSVYEIPWLKMHRRLMKYV